MTENPGQVPEPGPSEGSAPQGGGSTSGKPTRWLGAAGIVAAVGLGVAALVVAVQSDHGGSNATAANGTSSTGCPITRIAEQELPSVVTIAVAGPSASGTGSGEVIDNSGHILTNNHVISAAADGGQIQVVFSNGTAQSARIVGRDPETDLAVVQVSNANGLRPIQFGSSAALRVGEPVVALGAPLGLSSTVTAGIVSARDRSVNVPSDDGATALLVAAIQTDAAINPGNSGGALVNCAGSLVGIPSAGATVPTEGGGTSAGSIGLGFAIPSDFARTIANDLITHGSVTHGFFGISVDATASSGLFVVAVTAGGPAESAGLRPGDVITQLAGTPANSAEQLLELTLTHRPGEAVPVTYVRDGTTHQAQITLGSR